MGKYDDYCKPMFLRQDERPRPNRPGTWVLGQEYRFLTEYAKWSPYVVEYIPLLPADEKAMKHFHGQDDNVFHTANVERDGHKGGGYCGKELAQNVRLRGQILSTLQTVMKEYDGKGRILYHIVYAGGQSFGIILSFAVNESVLTMKRSIVEIGDMIQARMDRMRVSIQFVSGNIYHSIMDVGFSYAEAYRSFAEEPDELRKQEKEKASDKGKWQAEASDEVKVIEDDIVLRIQHAISMVQLDDTEAAQELLRRVLENGMNLCGNVSEKRQYYNRFLHAFSDELVNMKNINIAAFPPEIFSEKEDALADREDRDILEYAQQRSDEILLNLSKILKKKQNHYFVTAKEYICANYNDCDLSLNLVAEKVGANPSYISRLFKEILGISFTSYLTNCRMEASLDLLAKKEIPIREVAELSGFNTIQNYMRLFKKYYGMTPGQYRDSLQS